MSRSPRSALLAFVLAACAAEPQPEDQPAEGETASADTADTSGAGEPSEISDTSSGSDLPTVPPDPLAIGITYQGGITASNQLTYYSYASADSIYAPYLVISVADLEYFSLVDPDDYTRQQHVCDFYAEFPHILEEDVLGYGFAYDAGTGGNGEAYPLWFFADGRADIFANALAVGPDNELFLDAYGQTVDSPACASLLQKGYPDILDGMHVGLGLGPHSTFMYEEYWDSFSAPPDPNLEPATQTLYTAINHPSSNATGYDFVAYDWGSAIFFQATANSTTLYDAYGAPFPAELVVARVDAAGYLLYGTPQTDALVRSYAYWYEDYVNLDLSLLKEGVPAGL